MAAMQVHNWLSTMGIDTNVELPLFATALPAFLYLSSGVAAGAALLAFLRPAKPAEATDGAADEGQTPKEHSVVLAKSPASKLERHSSDTPQTDRLSR